MGESTLIHPGRSRLSKLLDEEIFLKQELTLFFFFLNWHSFMFAVSGKFSKKYTESLLIFIKNTIQWTFLWYSRWKLSPVITKGNTYIMVHWVVPTQSCPQRSQEIPACPHSFPRAVGVLSKAPFPPRLFNLTRRPWKPRGPVCHTDGMVFRSPYGYVQTLTLCPLSQVIKWLLPLRQD